MTKSWILAAACLTVAAATAVSAMGYAAVAAPAKTQSTRDGIVKVKSAYGLDETIARLKADIEKKGIVFFSQIDQSKLAGVAGVSLRPSTLLVFGNPALGSLFITANPVAGLDWPVRLLVYQDASSQVWTAYTAFDVIARRHGITNRREAFKTASQVIASITSSVAAK